MGEDMTYNLEPYQTKALESLKEKVDVSFRDKQVSIWGIRLSAYGSPESDVIFSKFLRARNFNAGRAFNMLRECLWWRHEFGADSILEQDLGFKEFEGVVSYMNGVDKEGHPIWWENNYGIFENKEIYNKFLGDDKKLEKFLRWKVQVLERGIKMLDFKPSGTKSITMVYNVRGLPNKEHKFYSKHLFPLLRNNYPGIIDFEIILNAPWYLRPLFKDETSKANYLCPKKANVAETLYKYIKPEYIPIQYNGLCRPDELKDGLVKPATEFTVNGGEVTNIPIQGIEEGATITWDVVVAGWDLTYSVQFTPDAVESYGIVVEKSRKMLEIDEALHGSYVAKETGKLVLIIDNTASQKKKFGAWRFLIQKKVKYDHDESYESPVLYENNCLFSSS
uniref:patellin-6-like n=1 Tax=Erigeron canadensis TaxID=72917 RepID=UPI001CB89BDD|nr:patellin-6-like [Erigeron canadensis]